MLMIGICDDVAWDRNLLKTWVEHFLDLKNIQYKIFVYKTGDELLRDGLFLRFDIIFLDLEMPRMQGISLGTQIREENKIAKIIYITKHESDIYKAVNDVHCFFFWIKPLAEASFHDHFCSVLDYMRIEKNKMKLIIERTCCYFSSPEIIYFKSADSGSFIALKNKTIRIYYSLANLEKLCNAHEFARPNRSCLVSLANVDSVDNDWVTLTNQERIPLSRRRKHDFKKQYENYLHHHRC